MDLEREVELCCTLGTRLCCTSVPIPFLFLSARLTHEGGKECAEISYFDIDLKNNTMVL